MRANAIFSFLTFGGGIVLAIFAAKIHEHETLFWALAGICFLLAILIWALPSLKRVRLLLPRFKQSEAEPARLGKEWKNVSAAIELFAEGSLRKTRDKCEAEFIEASGKVHEAENQVGNIRIKYANAPYGAEEANARNAAHDKLEAYGIYLNQAKYELTSAWDTLREEINKKLCRGELVAKGFRVPHVGGNTEIEILPAEWRVLLLDSAKSEAIRKNDGGTVYTGILVSKA
jgi:hypothetical protein